MTGSVEPSTLTRKRFSRSMGVGRDLRPEKVLVPPVRSTVAPDPVMLAGAEVRLSVSSSREINWVLAVVSSSLTSLYDLI